MSNLFNLDEFSDTNQTEETRLDTDTGRSDFLIRHPLLNTICELGKKAAGYQVARFMFLGVFTVAMMALTMNYTKSVDIAGGLADAGAKDDYVGFFKIFAKESGHKSTKLNMHPFFHTKGVRSLESKFNVEFDKKIKFSKIFAYAIYDEQDFMVMRSAARGKDNARLNLDHSTFFSMSADDYCEDYFDGFLPDEEMEAVFVKSWRVKRIKNKEDQKRFRCVIGPDVIEDFVEDDKE
jgi:hypothetical protein